MSKVISKDGTSIACDQSGTGFPLILVDGALCRRAFGPMDGFAKSLSQDFTVINYHRRGRIVSSNAQLYDGNWKTPKR